MSIVFLLRRAFAAAVAAPLVAALSSAALAGAQDYEFQPVTTEVKAGREATIAVRLVSKVTGKPVEGAVIFRSRLDMEPDGMADMVSPVALLPSDQAGVYRFKADLSMAGAWALKVMAKVPGEAETIEGSVVIKAKE